MHSTWICDTRDFGIGRRLNYDNWNALRSAGEHASQRRCDAEAASAVPASDVATLNQVTRPSVTGDGQRALALLVPSVTSGTGRSESRTSAPAREYSTRASRSL